MTTLGVLPKVYMSIDLEYAEWKVIAGAVTLSVLLVCLTRIGCAWIERRPKPAKEPTDV